MKIRLSLLVLWIFLAVSPVTVQADNPWQPVGDGIEFQESTLTGPIEVYVARMDRSNANAILDSGISNGRISYDTEKVSDMARDYDDSINFWKGQWGQRSKVVVAINGSYFNGIGAPISGQIISGWYAKRFDNLGGGSGLGYRMDQSIFIGQCVNNDPKKQNISIYRGVQQIATFPIDGLNIPRGTNQLIVYTPQYDDFTHTAADGVEVLVEMSRPTMVLPAPAFASGIVDQILDKHGQTLIPFDHIVLSASGTVRTALLAHLAAGDEVRVTQEITEYDKTCNSVSADQPWSKTYASIGGAFNILNNGQIMSSTDPGATAQSPRTAIAYNDQYIFFIVVDGRNSAHSVGMTFDELAGYAKTTLGATWAMAQDGGGSSVMVVNGQVKNQPVSQCPAIFLPFLGTAGSPAQNNEPTATPAAPAAPSSIFQFACERSVANTMMMIDVQPLQQSTVYTPADLITTQASTDIRLGPGTNYAAFASVPAGIEGMVLNHQEKLNGVEAKGSFWWKVAFGNVSGWVEEGDIAPCSPSQMSNPLHSPAAIN